MHSVQSEVAAELEWEPEEGCCVLRVTERQSSVAAELLYDSDGDLIVPRKRQRMSATSVAALPTTHRLHQPMAFALEAKDATTWQQAGSQLWRAAFLLAEFVLSSPVAQQIKCVLITVREVANERIGVCRIALTGRLCLIWAAG